MTITPAIVLYAVGSPLVAEVAETCSRLGVTIAAAVKNLTGAHYLRQASLLREPADLDAAIFRIPCIVPLFTPRNRDSATREAMAHGFKIAPALIDPTAILASSTEVGIGSYINAGTVIGAETRIAEHVIVNRSSSIGHHAEIGSMASIGPAAVLAGQVRIGVGALIGAGAIVLPKIEIGAGCVIAAGAVVTNDIPAKSIAAGNPAKVVKQGIPSIDARWAALGDPN